MESQSTWNVNRLLVIAGAAAILGGASLLMGDPAGLLSPQMIPLHVGVVAAIVLAFWARPWYYLVAGILVAGFPGMMLAMGGYNALLHPAGGAEAQGMWIVALGVVLALVGGIAGFVQGRRGAHASLAAPLRAPHGVLAVLLTAIVFGVLLTSGLATAEMRALSERPAAFIEGAQIVRVEMAEYQFAPRTVTIPAGELVVLEIVNRDHAAHTFTYHVGAQLRETLIPGGATVGIPLKFDDAQRVHFWCAPHSGGASDKSDESMWGTLVVQ